MIGITDIEIHFLQIKFTAIGVYLEPEIVKHLQQWKGKPGAVLAEDDDFFDALISGIIISAVIQMIYSLFIAKNNFSNLYICVCVCSSGGEISKNSGD